MPSSVSGFPCPVYMLGVVLSRLVSAIASSEAVSHKVLGLGFDRQRVPGLRNDIGLLKRQKSFSVTLNDEIIIDSINVTIGTPPQSFRVLLGTGASDTWVPAAGSSACGGNTSICAKTGSFDRTKSSTFQEISKGNFSVQYPDGSSAQGDYFSDILTIGRASNLRYQTIGLANSSSLPMGALGIGYGTEEVTPSEAGTAVYPNVVAQLQSSGVINTQAYSIWLNDIGSSTGSILFGGIDTAKFHGSLSILPIAKSPNDSTYNSFTVTLASVSLADASGKTVVTQDDMKLPVVLDAESPITALPELVVEPILRAIGAVNNSEFVSLVPCNLSSSPASLGFGFGGAGGPMIDVSLDEFVLPAIYPNGSSPRLQDGKQGCTFGLVPLDTQPYTLGDTFLRSVYAVFDLDNHQIGLAPTVFNSTDSNIVEISGSALPSATATASGAPNFSGSITNTASLAPFLTAASATIDLVGPPTSKGSGSATTSSGFAASASNESNHHSLSHSSKLGIGLGVWYGLVFLAIVGFLLYRFSRHRGRGKGAEKKELIGGGDAQPKFEGDDSPRRVGA